ncbi:plasmid partitioning protein RepA [Donghicola tyrosinivorans]|uniref:Chromosome partitioning protein n=1 Tax=Donghicola tyrosinivorans TaxID=1652492 RepID=A0A2T0WEJ6_9RHOB|nr:plasmid partitioning protein RepA [Donghicola tyrosinivorans]MEE3070049.1 plasmid partitioning protein RepA [Pseudomonadota bacterium]PRY85075.1 chromosome partitioning protein [Donghicola tyrosinivorans]
MSNLLHKHLQGFAGDLTTALKAMSESSFAPHDVKSLRSFSAGEASYYLGVADGYLRKAHHEGRIPDVEMGPGNRRRYTAEQIQEIRQVLAETAKKPEQFMPGRRDLEKDALQVWAFVNFKGGSGKTSTGIHVAHALALKGYKVLVMDCDPQASITTFFGYQPEIDFFDSGSLYDVIRYKDKESGEGPVPITDIIKTTYFPNLDLVPGGIQVAEFEHETPSALSRGELPVFFNKIRDALKAVENDYDLVIMDCPPQLGYVTLSAICAAQNIMMTLIPERVDMASAAQFLNMAASLTEVLHENAGIGLFDNFRFLLSRFDTNVATQVDLAGFIRELFGDAVMKSAFLKSSAVSEAGISQQTVLEVDLTEVKNRKTYERAIQSVHEITDEMEQIIQASWGRSA